MTNSNDFHCFKCNAVLSTDSIGRRDSCPSCNSDVRVCKNCSFYDLKAYNECRESQAERVLEKDRANFCGYFKPRLGAHNQAGASSADVFKQLDDLFKK